MRVARSFAFSLVLMLSSLACEGPPCIPYQAGLRPAIVGETVSLDIGTIRGTDCVVGRSNRVSWTWHSEDTQIVRVSTDGVVEAIGPGPFRLTASHDGTVLRTSGFALPPGWRMSISPKEVTVAVGDSVSFLVTTFAPDGSPLRQMPFSVYTPEYGQPGPDANLPLVDRYSQQDVSEPAVFTAVRPGTTQMFGRIGGRTAIAILRVVEESAD